MAKLTADAAEEVLALVSPGTRLAESLEGQAQQLAQALQVRQRWDGWDEVHRVG